MPAPTEVAATRRQGRGMRSAVVAACQANHAMTTGVLFQVLLAHALVEIHVGVVHADVVVLVLLDRIEAGHAGGAEAEMIGVADARDDVAAHAEILVACSGSSHLSNSAFVGALSCMYQP